MLAVQGGQDVRPHNQIFITNLALGKDLLLIMILGSSWSSMDEEEECTDPGTLRVLQWTTGPLAPPPEMITVGVGELTRLPPLKLVKFECDE